MDLFRFQAAYNPVYAEYIAALGTDVAAVQRIEQIPFLPIRFFKTATIQTTAFEPETFFESSGTTQTVNSRHYVKDLSLYRESFLRAFELFYGPVQNWCILGLLPAYLERRHSSLVVMVDDLIQRSRITESGFYLYDHEKLQATLQQLESRQQPTLLIGVTFALLDFAEQFPMTLQYTTLMETGGMKGRRQEMIREELHDVLTKAFGVASIHSEYGMTELLSQAYSSGNGLFRCPPWMKILVREEDDPLHVTTSGAGVVNVIDLANIYSCAFIATDDVGKVHDDGAFTIQGRMDASDIRGCSLMAAAV